MIYEVRSAEQVIGSMAEAMKDIEKLDQLTKQLDQSFKISS